jgi:exopolysaccharide biosynthesis WecB/TagA/CpsF family protein
MKKRKYIFSMPIDDIDLKDAFQIVVNAGTTTPIIVTPNVDHIVRLNKDSSFKDVYLKADFYFNDSRILRLISKLGLDRISNVVPGSDLTEYVFNNFSQLKPDYSICVIGAEEGDIDILQSKYDVGRIHHYNPPFGFINDPQQVEKCIQYCQALPQCIFLLSVGSPRQEVLAHKLKEAGVEGVFLCVGASVLFLSGREKRAPKLMQVLALEWVYRLFQSPKRLFRRYLVEGPFIIFLYAREIIKRITS